MSYMEAFEKQYHVMQLRANGMITRAIPRVFKVGEETAMRQSLSDLNASIKKGSPSPARVVEFFIRDATVLIKKPLIRAKAVAA